LYKQYTERAAALMKIDGADFVGENLNAMGEALARCQTIPAASRRPARSMSRTSASP